MDSRKHFSVSPRTPNWASRWGRALALGVAAPLGLILVQSVAPTIANANALRSCLSNPHASRSLAGTNPELKEAIRAWKRGDSVKATRCAEKVVRDSYRYQDRRTAHTFLCGLHREAGNGEISLQHCNLALEREHGRVWQHLANRGHTNLVMGRSQEAIIDFDAAIALLEAHAERPWRTLESAREALERLRAHRETAQQLVSRGAGVALR